MPLRCYQKEPNGTFTLVDVAKNAESKTVYVPTNGNIETKYLFYVSDDDIRLYATRKVGGTCTIVPNTYQIYDKKEGEWFSAHKFSQDESKRPANVTPAILTKVEETDLSLQEKIMSFLHQFITILEQKQRENPSIEEQIKWRYTCYMDELLADLLNNFSAKNLETFLKEHWDTIKGGMLCYTDQPNHPVTELLSEMAIALAHAKDKPESALEILMPGLCTESQYPGSFGDLNRLPADKDEASIHIKKILATHVTMSMADYQRCYLIPASIFAGAKLDRDGEQYPVIHIEEDKDKIPNPYCDSFDSPDDAFLDDSTLKRLALHNEHTVDLFKAKKSYDAIASNQDTLLGQLNQLISGLMHGSAHGGHGEQKVAADSAFSAIHRFNEYYKEINPEQKSGIPALHKKIDEMLQLAAPQYDDYQLKVVDAEPPELTPGIIYLYKNKEQWVCLIDGNKNEIILPPDDINNPNAQQDKILEVLAAHHFIPESKKHYVDQTAKMVSCVGRQGEKLRELVNAEQGRLAAITLNAESCERMLQEQKDIYERSQKALNDSQNHVGAYDAHLSIDKKVLALLALEPDRLITNDNQLKSFMRLTVPQIEELCQDPKVAHQIVTVINSVNNLIIFVTQNDTQKIQVVFKYIAAELFNKRIINLTNIANDRRLDEIQMWGPPPDNIDLCALLQPLTATQCRAVFEGLKVALLQILNKLQKPYVFFQIILERLTPEQRQAILDSVIDRIGEITKNASGFNAVLKLLTPEKRKIVYNILNKDPIFYDSIKTGFHLHQVLMYLEPAERIAVYHCIKDRVLEIVMNSVGNKASAFSMVLVFLTPAQCKEVCDKLKDDLNKIIKTAFEFCNVLEKLPQEHRTHVYNSMKNSLPELIKGLPGNFSYAVEHLAPEQAGEIYDGVKHELYNNIKNVDQLRTILKFLKPEQCADVCRRLKDRMVNIIKNAIDFNGLLKSLTPEQRTVVYISLEDRIDKMINSAENFGNVLQFLTAEQRMAVCNKIKDDLGKIMKSSMDFWMLFRKLKEGTDNTEAYNSTKHLIAGVINYGEDFSNVLEFLTPEQRTEAYNSTKHLIAGVIYYSADFSNVLEFLTPEQRTEVFKEVFESEDKKTLRRIIENDDDYSSVSKFLTSEQRATLHSRLFGRKVIKRLSEQVYLYQRISDGDFFIRYEKPHDLCWQQNNIRIQIQMRASHPNSINPSFMRGYSDQSFAVESEGDNGFSDANSLTRYIPFFSIQQRRFAAKSIARQLFAPLMYFDVVHDKQHRNVCPETIFICGNGSAKLGLFNLIGSFTSHGNIDEAAEKRIRENPDGYLRNPYIAPECRPKSDQAITEDDIYARIFSDAKADVWAVGVTMLSTLVGKIFLPEKEQAQAFEKEKALFHLIQPALNKENYLESLKELAPNAKDQPDVQQNILNLIAALEHDPKLAYLLHRCLQFDPEKRASLAEANALIYLLGGHTEPGDIKDSWETTSNLSLKNLIDNKNDCLWKMDEKKQIHLTDMGRNNCRKVSIELYTKLNDCRRDRAVWSAADERCIKEAKSTQAAAWKTLKKQVTEVRNESMISAAREGKKENVERFLASDPDAIKEYFNRESVLIAAVKNGHLEVVVMLLEKLHQYSNEGRPRFFPSDDLRKSYIKGRVNIRLSELKKRSKAMDKVTNEQLKTLGCSEALINAVDPEISLSVLHIAMLFGYKDIEDILRKTMADAEFDVRCDIKVDTLRDFLKVSQDEERGSVREPSPQPGLIKITP